MSQHVTLDQYLSGESVPQVDGSLYGDLRDFAQKEIDLAYENLGDTRYSLSEITKNQLREGFVLIAGIVGSDPEKEGRIRARYGVDNVRIEEGIAARAIYIRFTRETVD